MSNLDSQQAASGQLQVRQVPHIANHFRLQWEEVQNAYVLLYPEGMVKLNESAGEILSRCNGKATIAEIIAALTEKFPEANEQDIQQDVLEFFADAINQRWAYVE